MLNIGFIGLGAMGLPMCLRLLDAGYGVSTYAPRRTPEALTSRTRVCESPTEVARVSDVIILMLPDTQQVEAVLFDESGVALGLTAGKAVIDMSSISPTATKAFASLVEAIGCDYLDAPVSGGAIGAAAGSLAIMIGGKEDVVNRYLPVFRVMGKTINRVGDHGAGQTAKVANQIIVGLTIAAVAEALTFASQTGADPAAVRHALMGGFASSRVLEVHGQRMIDDNFTAGFKMRLHQKDLAIALASARDVDSPLPLTALVSQLMVVCASNGLADADHSSLVVASRLMAGAPR